MTKSYNSPFEHVDYNAIIDGTKGNGIISGLTVTERGAGQNMSVDVAAGSALISWVKYTEASTVNVVITVADGTNPRKDIIIYDVATTNPAVVTGTPAAEPIPPDITSGDILLAVVNVAANETTIANTDIEDGRITVQDFHHTTHELGGSDEIVDVARDILPTLTALQWTTPQSNLANITDGNSDNSSTQSTTQVQNDIEEILIDLGSLFSTYLVTYDYAIQSTYSSTAVLSKIYTSPDNSNWTEMVSNSSSGTTAWVRYSGLFTPAGKIRYVKVYFHQDFTHDVHAKIYNIGVR